MDVEKFLGLSEWVPRHFTPENVAKVKADVDDLTIILARVSSNDIAALIAKIKTISGVTKVNVASRHSGEHEKSSD